MLDLILMVVSVIPTVDESVVQDRKAAKKSQPKPAMKAAPTAPAKSEPMASVNTLKEVSPQSTPGLSQAPPPTAGRGKISFGLKRKTEGEAETSKKPRL